MGGGASQRVPLASPRLPTDLTFSSRPGMLSVSFGSAFRPRAFAALPHCSAWIAASPGYGRGRRAARCPPRYAKRETALRYSGCPSSSRFSPRYLPAAIPPPPRRKRARPRSLQPRDFFRPALVRRLALLKPSFNNEGSGTRYENRSPGSGRNQNGARRLHRKRG